MPKKFRNVIIYYARALDYVFHSSVFYEFPSFLDNKKIINTDGTWYFYSNFSALLYFFLSFNDILLNVFSKNPIKLAKPVNSNQYV